MMMMMIIIMMMMIFDVWGGMGVGVVGIGACVGVRACVRLCLQ